MKAVSMTVTALLCFLFLSGCALHRPARDYKTPAFPEKFNSGKNNASPDLSCKWWLKFNDQGLNRIIEQTLENNSDIDQAYHRFAQASAYFKGKSAELFPRLDINGTAKTEDSEHRNATLNSFSISLAASYEIDLWGKLNSAKKAAGFTRQASLFDLKTLYVSITSQAAELYFRALAKKEELGLYTEKLTLNRENLTIADLNYQEGISDASLVYGAKQNLASAQSEALHAKAAFAKLIHALSILQGKYPEIPDHYSLPGLYEFNEEFPNGIPSDLLKNRPDIQKVLSGLRAADYEIGVAMARRFPSLSLGADLGYSGNDMTGSMVRGSFANLVANLIMPVLDWGKRKAEVKRVKSKFNENLFAYKKAVLNGFMEAEDAISDYKAAAASLETIKILTENAGAAYKQKENKYNYGLIKYSSVIAAATELIDAKKRLNQARLEMILRNIALVRAMGGTWMNEDIKKMTHQEKDR